MVTGELAHAPRERIVAGNWKMVGNRAANAVLLSALRAEALGSATVVVCPPAAYLADAASAVAGSAIALGGQDCSAHDTGAFTGEVAAAMLADVGCAFAIVGHSERRAWHGESDALVAAKTLRAIAAGLRPIVCVGETLEERDADRTVAVVERQLAAVLEALAADAAGARTVVVAYEPVWAIGTGRTASPDQAQAVHARIRARLADASLAAVPVLYGGSVKADNAAALFAQPDVDGGLVGGASLKAAEFAAICRAAS